MTELHRPDLVIQFCEPDGAEDLAILSRLRDSGRHQCDLAVLFSTLNLGLVLRAGRLGIVFCLALPVQAEILRKHVKLWQTRRSLRRNADYRDILDQERIDLLVHGAALLAEPMTEEPAKSENNSTLDLVALTLRSSDGYTAAAVAAEQCGLSSVAVRRYLNTLVDQGYAATEVRYGTGRPTKMYRCIRTL